MNLQFKVYPKKHLTMEGRKAYPLSFEVQLPDRTKMAWMDFSVIFIGNPNKPDDLTQSKAVDGRKILFVHCSFGELRGQFNIKIEVWKKSPLTKQENDVTMFKRLELDYLADLTIKCGDESIEVHKVLLAQSSEFFRGKANT